VIAEPLYRGLTRMGADSAENPNHRRAPFDSLRLSQGRLRNKEERRCLNQESASLTSR
jgi:hypothetical protein